MTGTEPVSCRFYSAVSGFGGLSHSLQNKVGVYGSRPRTELWYELA